MNQILDHSGPKKQKIHRNPGDTARIIKVYAFLIMVFAICLIGKAAYSMSENKKINSADTPVATAKFPQIVLSANEDILTINVNSADKGIELVSYQWYKGEATIDQIKQYQAEHEATSSEENENDDEESNIDEDEIVAIGETEVEKSNKDDGQSEMLIRNIGIPKGQSTIHVIVKTVGSDVTTEYVESYYTDVGVDKIKPQVSVVVQGRKLLVTATDETEIDYLTYSVNGSQEVQVSDRTDKKTIKAEIDSVDTETTKVLICAVDKAKNSRAYEKEFDFFTGSPKIELLGEGPSDNMSKIYVRITYPRGITKVEYELNGKKYDKEFPDPKEAREVNFEVETEEGHNYFQVWAYTEQEEVWSTADGDCEYHPND